MANMDSIKAAADVIREDLEYTEKIRKNRAARVIKYARDLVNSLNEYIDMQGDVDTDVLAVNIAGTVRSFDGHMQGCIETMENADREAYATRSALETLLAAINEA